MSRGTTSKAPATAATRELQRLGVAFVPHPYESSADGAGYGLEAAQALGVPPERVFKTLLARVGDGYAVGVVPVSRSLDLRALATALGAKHAVMADPKDAERRTGYVVGGISPVGQRTPSPLVLDDGALLHPTVFVSGGRRGFDVELAPADLLSATGGRTAAIAR